jgi:hypothetical protein
MKQFLLGGLTIIFLAAAVGLSLDKAPPSADLQIIGERRNPWTHLRLNNDPADFHFAVVSDRTGGHRPKVFSKAIEQLNLLQPEFVISVGDLIEGYKDTPAKLDAEWREFQAYVNKLQMPFFYVPGNHDVSNLYQGKVWQEKFGRRYYHFVYRQVLFLLLDANDPTGKDSRLSPEQIAYAKKALEQNPDVRWTIVMVHKPLWANADIEKNGWGEIERLLSDRPYTVFAGHVHTYEKFVRNGRNYYQLATTGGSSKVRGVRYGEFDHLTWVTMKKGGPVLANLMLDGIYPEDMRPITTDEPGVASRNRKPLHPVRGRLYGEGCPLPDALVVLHLINPEKKTTTRTCDGLVDADGSFVLSTYAAEDGAPVGEYAVTIERAAGRIPARYAKAQTTPLRVKITTGENNLSLDLQK